MSVERRCLDFIEGNLTDAYALGSNGKAHERPAPKEPPIEPINITNFDDLNDTFAESLYWTKSMRDTLAVGLACNISVPLSGELLWCYIRGPASSGKSTICDSIGAATDYAAKISKFTGMHSGYKVGKSKKDYSVLKTVNHKMMIIKDWTSVLSLPETLLKNIYGELRDIYDGSTETHYRTEVRRSYKDVRFSILAAVTDEILRHNHSHLGERFFAVDISDETHGSHKHVKTGLRHIIAGIQASYPQGNAEQTVPPDRLLKIKRSTVGFLDHLHQQIRTCRPVHVPEDILDRFTQSARFIARLRGRVVREGRMDEIAYKPRSEVAIRLGGQLVKLGMNLATVLGREEVDAEVFEVVTKVGVDTAHGTHFDVIRSLMECHDQDEFLGLEAGQIAAKIGYLKKETVRKKLENLTHLNLVKQVNVPNNSGVGGRHNHIWEVLPHVRRMWHGFIGV